MSDVPVKLSKKALKAAVAAKAKQIGFTNSKLPELVEALNQAGILTATGKKWKKNNLRNYVSDERIPGYQKRGESAENDPASRKKATADLSTGPLQDKKPESIQGEGGEVPVAQKTADDVKDDNPIITGSDVAGHVLQAVGKELLTLEQSVGDALPGKGEVQIRKGLPTTGERVTNRLPVDSEQTSGEDISNDLVTSPTKERMPSEQQVTNELPIADDQRVTQELLTQPAQEEEWPSRQLSNELLTIEDARLIKALLTDYQRGNLADMLETWKQHQGAYISTSERRPAFKGKRRNTGLHVNEKILELAAEKVKVDRQWSGGSLSLLVERLLWAYVGSPENLIDKPETI